MALPLAAALLAGCGGPRPAGAPLAGGAGTIAHAGGEVVIDGVLDEPCWAAAEAVRADYAYGNQGTLAVAPKMVARYAWDENFLYVAYETFDANLVAVGKDRHDGPADNRRQGCEIWKPNVKVDVVEFFLSLEDPNFFWELHHNAANQFNDVWITVIDPAWPLAERSLFPYGIIFGDDQFLADDGPAKFAAAVRLKPKADGKPSTINDESDADAGYTAELRLPWAGLGVPKARRLWRTLPPAEGQDQPRRVAAGWDLAGQTIRILAVVQDGDGAERYHHSSPTRPPGGWFHTSYDYWTRYTLLPPAGGD